MQYLLFVGIIYERKFYDLDQMFLTAMKELCEGTNHLPFLELVGYSVRKLGKT